MSLVIGWNIHQFYCQVIGMALALESQMNGGGPSAIVGCPGEFFAQNLQNSGKSHYRSLGG